MPRHNSLVFVVQLWDPKGPAPRSIREALHRQKDIQYSSRIATYVAREQQTHRLRHVISQLVQHIPAEQRNSAMVRELAHYGCVTQMHLVRLLAPRIGNESYTKDIDFSASTIAARRDAGYRATVKALELTPWQGEFDPIEGVILHEALPDLPAAAE
jgi:NTE family protein